MVTKTSSLINVRTATLDEIKIAVNRLVENVSAIKENYATTEDVEEIVGDVVSSDTTPPVNPGDLVATKYENRNRLDWTNSTSSDTRVTYVYRATEEGGTKTKIGQVAYPTDYYEDFAVQPKQSYWYYIRCADEVPNYSDYVPDTDGDNVVSATTVPAPSEVLQVGTSWNQDDLNVYWDEVDDFGVTGYYVTILSGETQRRSETVIDPKYAYTFAKNTEDDTAATSITIRVWTLDEDGDPSAAYAEETFAHDTPPVVLGVTAETTDIGFQVTWTQSTDPSVIGYDVALDGDILETCLASEAYLYKTLLVADDYQFQVRSRNRFNQTSSWNTANFTVHGPYEPSNVRAEVIDNTVMLYWDDPSTIELAIAEYEIRKGDVYGTSSLIGTKKGNFTTVIEQIAGTFKYWVAAKDIAGNIGTPVSVTTAVDEPADYVLNVNWVDDYDTGGSYSNVLINSDGTAIAPYNTAETWATHFTNNSYTTIQDFINGGYTYLPEPVPTSAEYSEEHDYGTVLGSSSISSTIDKVDYNGGPTITTYIAEKELVGDSYTETQAERIFAVSFRYVRDRFEFVSDGTEFAVLNNHTLRLDSKLKSDAGQGEVTTASTGVTITFNKAFVDVASITVTPFGDGSIPIMAVVDFTDVPNPTDFDVYLLNSTSGTKITGTFSWQAKGY